MEDGATRTAADASGQSHRPVRLPQYMFPRGVPGWIMARIMPWAHGALYREAARALKLRPEDDVLDVACGGGRFLKKYAGHVRYVAGLDASPIQVHAACRAHRRRVREGTAHFVLGDASQLPWPDGRFSAASLIGAFVGLPKPEEALRELHRVLRPGGRALVTVELNAEDGQDHSKQVEGWGMRLWTERDLLSAAHDTGFVHARVGYASAPDMPRIMLLTGSKA